MPSLESKITLEISEDEGSKMQITGPYSRKDPLLEGNRFLVAHTRKCLAELWLSMYFHQSRSERENHIQRMDWYRSIINIQCISSWKSREEKSQSQRCKKIHNTNYVNGHPCNQLGKAASSWGVDQNNIRAWKSFLMNSSQLFDLQQVKLEEKQFGKVGLFLNSNSFR